MRREFLINIFFLVTINLLIKPFYIFGIDRTIQNEVGAQSYGLFFALFNFTFLLQIVNDFGIHYFNNRSISQHRQLVGKYFPNILLLKLGLALLYLVLVFLAARLAGYEWAVFHILLFLSLTQIFTSLLLYLRSNLSGLGYFRLDSLLSAADKLLLIAIAGYLLWSPATRGQFRIEWLVYAQTAAVSVTALIAFLLLRRHLGKLKFRLRRSFLVFLIRESYPYALAVFLMTLYTRIDAVMLERMLGDGGTEAGIYASAYRLLDASNMIGFLFAGLLLPMFSRMLKAGEPVGPLLRMSFNMIMAGAITLSLGCFFYREEIMFALYTEATPYWGQVMGILMYNLIAVSGMYIFSTLLTAAGRLNRMNRIFAVSIFMNVVLNLVLIPKEQAAGAAIATLGTQFFTLIAMIVLAGRELRIPGLMPVFGRVFLFAALLFGIGFALTFFSETGWFIKFIGIMSGGLILGMGMRLLDWRHFSTFAERNNP